MISSIALSALLGLGVQAITASPLLQRDNSTSTTSNTTSSSSSSSAQHPTVTIYPDTSAGNPIEITGLSNSTTKQDQYLGIPFAQPPVGDLRFAPPQSYQYNFSVTAQSQPQACLQDPTSGYLGAAGASEDCLYLNVYTPQGANAQTAWLPVMLWVYGGSFTAGDVTPYDPTYLQLYADATDRPFIFVELNYRLGVFGWGYGSGFAENGATNLGLKDIRKGLEWIQDNIWAFGGDPSQVTVFGESAGAIAISLLYLDESINTFKGAIMESGAQSTLPLGPANSTWEDAYDYLLAATNCSSVANETQFECLKELPAASLLQGQLAVKSQIEFAGFVYGPSIDGDLIPDSPHTLLSEGKFAKIPFITGNNKDEGTIFVVPSFVNSTLAVLEYVDLLEPKDPSNTTLLELTQLYPDVPALGSPFDTGNETFGYASNYKQASAILGDANFQANRRFFLQQANAHGLNQTWTYQFEQYTPGAAAARGVYHGSEIPFVYGAARPGVGAAGFSSNYTAADGLLSNTIMDYWLNFAYYTNPNSASSNETYWSTYSEGSGKNILRLLSGNVTIFTDDYREQQMEYFLSMPTQFNYKRDIGDRV